MYSATLVIDAHERRHPGTGSVQPGHEAPELPGGAHVPAEEHDPPRRMLAQKRTGRAVQLRPRDAHHEELGHRTAEERSRHGEPCIACGVRELGD